MNNEIKIETKGGILEGEYKNWFVFVEDDYKNTGGYLILIFNHPKRLKSSQGYDYWAEDKDTLEAMFKEAKWKVQWLDEISYEMEVSNYSHYYLNCKSTHYCPRPGFLDLRFSHEYKF